MTDYELGDYHRLTTKGSSGAYIGFLCIAIIWLLPIGIIVSGGTGNTAIRAGSFLEQSVIEDPTTFKPLIWENVRRGEHCLRFKTRKYTAKSIGNHRGRAGMEECKASSAHIHGVELRPTFCEDLVRLLSSTVSNCC